MRITLLVLVIATVAVNIALVPGYAGVRDWVVAFSVVAGLMAVAVLGASLLPASRFGLEPRRRTGDWPRWPCCWGPAGPRPSS